MVDGRFTEAKQGRNSGLLRSRPMDEGSADDVVILRWPDEQTRLADLRQRRIPRLALVSPHAPAFLSSDPLEDWVRLPASEGDVRARVRTLLARAHDERPDAPELDDGRVLRYGSWWTTLAPTEARLAGTFVDRFGGGVSRVELASAGWPQLPGRSVGPDQAPTGRLGPRPAHGALTRLHAHRRTPVLRPRLWDPGSGTPALGPRDSTATGDSGLATRDQPSRHQPLKR